MPELLYMDFQTMLTHRRRANAMMRSGQYAGAERLYLEALDFVSRPDRYATYWSLVNSYIRSIERTSPARAEAVARAAIAGDIRGWRWEVPPSVKVLLYRKLGVMRMGRGDLSGARDDLLAAEAIGNAHRPHSTGMDLVRRSLRRLDAAEADTPGAEMGRRWDPAQKSHTFTTRNTTETATTATSDQTSISGMLLSM